MGKKASKNEGICRKSRDAQSSDYRRSTRNRDNGDPVLDGDLNKAIPGVGDARRASVRNEGNLPALRQFGEDEFLFS